MVENVSCPLTPSCSSQDSPQPCLPDLGSECGTCLSRAGPLWLPGCADVNLFHVDGLSPQRDSLIQRSTKYTSLFFYFLLLYFILFYFLHCFCFLLIECLHCIKHGLGSRRTCAPPKAVSSNWALKLWTSRWFKTWIP